MSAGTDSASVGFDGLPEPVGASGLVVTEMATPLGNLFLLEFRLTTADGEPFLEQLADVNASSSVIVDDLTFRGEVGDDAASEEAPELRLA